MFAMITGGYSSAAIESFNYFDLQDQVALEGFSMSGIIGILNSLLEKIKKLIKTLSGWAVNVAKWFKTKVLQLRKAKYIEMPKGQFAHFKEATSTFLNITRAITFVVPQLVAMKVRVLGKIGNAVKSINKAPLVVKIVGDILAQADTVAETLDKIGEDLKTSNLSLQFAAYERFVQYAADPDEPKIRVPISNLKYYMTISETLNDLYETVTESLTEIQDGIKDYIEILRKDDEGNGILNDDEMNILITNLTRVPAMFGRLSNMMVVVTNNSMVMINVMLGMQEQTPDPFFKKRK